MIDTQNKTEKLRAGIYVISTPIGNLKDITLRALEALQSVDLLYCEDSRVTNKLLSAHGIKASMRVYNDHSGAKERIKIFKAIENGTSIGIVSDAGTPLISDPGYKLISEAYDRGIEVNIIPGVSSVTAALTLSGLPTDKFTFLGFLPPKEQAKKNLLSEYLLLNTTLILFERNSRLIKTLNVLNEVFGNVNCSVVREITKTFEEVKRGRINDLIDYYNEFAEPKGEIVILVELTGKVQFSENDLDEEIMQLLKVMSTKELSAQLSKKYKIPKKEIYGKALSIKGK